tara:strand:- start:447 stop:1430 length:984 start_codon:yes stop_codon:yes gene_type:complete
LTALSECLLGEAEAISNAANQLDEDQVNKSLKIINNCFTQKGKLIISGVGKSGIVARKISATFSSIGLMSIYLNPLDALHGDLGIAAEGDAAIFISNSGNTEELLEILPHLKKRNIATISIVGNEKSTLANKCDCFLNSFVSREICPLNLAPTTSTAVAMAIGDALAAVWMQKNNISEKDFALNHPAGFLGLRLTKTVKDLMIDIDSINSLDEKASLQEIIPLISSNAIGGICILKKQKLVGLITDGDLRRSLENSAPEIWSSLKAKKLMTANPITICDKDLAINALELMEHNKKKSISILPVLNKDEKLVGILRLHDLIKAGLIKK